MKVFDIKFYYYDCKILRSGRCIVYANDEKEAMGQVEKYIELRKKGSSIIKEKTQISQVKEEPVIVYSEIGSLVKDKEL